MALAPREAPRVGLPMLHRQAGVVGRGCWDAFGACSARRHSPWFFTGCAGMQGISCKLLR
jgi:hypothetical protein